MTVLSIGWLSRLARSILQWLATYENCSVWVQVQVEGIAFISKTPSLQQHDNTGVYLTFAIGVPFVDVVGTHDTQKYN